MNAPFSLTEEQTAMQDMVVAFARDEVAPFALEWDEKRHLPLDIIRQTADLGMGGIYVRDDVGGSDLSGSTVDGTAPLLNDQTAPPDAVARLRQMIAERETETVQILQDWMEDDPKREQA